jgi:hypothetical protein
VVSSDVLIGVSVVASLVELVRYSQVQKSCSAMYLPLRSVEARYGRLTAA